MGWTPLGSSGPPPSRGCHEHRPLGPRFQFSVPVSGASERDSRSPGPHPPGTISFQPAPVPGSSESPSARQLAKADPQSRAGEKAGGQRTWGRAELQPQLPQQAWHLRDHLCAREQAGSPRLGTHVAVPMGRPLGVGVMHARVLRLVCPTDHPESPSGSAATRCGHGPWVRSLPVPAAGRLTGLEGRHSGGFPTGNDTLPSCCAQHAGDPQGVNDQLMPHQRPGHASHGQAPPFLMRGGGSRSP